MTAIAKAVSRVFLSGSSNRNAFTEIAMLCGAGLLISVLFLTYGLDLSPGLF